METIRLIGGKQFKILRPKDYICQRCLVEPTNSREHICELCKAQGKTFEPIIETSFLEDIQIGTQYLLKTVLGFKI